METKAKEEILKVSRKERQNTYKETVTLKFDLSIVVTEAKICLNNSFKKVREKSGYPRTAYISKTIF